MHVRQWPLLFSLYLLALPSGGASQTWVQTTAKGCYSGLSGFTSVGTSTSMTSMYCAQQCMSQGYAVGAVTNGDECYCGNTVPSGSTTDGCSISCPAYPSEMCGGSDGEYNVFVIVGMTTSAAAGGTSTSNSKSSTSSQTATSTTTSSSSSSNTQTESSSSHTDSSSSTGATSTSASTSATGTSSTDSASHSSTSTSSSASSSSESPSSSSSGSSQHATSTVAQTATATVTATSSSTASATAAAQNHDSKKGLSGGAIAGIVVGSLAGVAAIAAVVILLFLRRRRGDDEYYSPEASPSRFKDSTGGSFHSGYNTSYPIVDQRLNPTMLGGDHRISIASLADARDYSRQILTVANPDEKS